MAGRRLFAAIPVTLALALLTDAASAQDYIVRDGSGRRVGTVEQGIGERLIQRDASGRRTGTIPDQQAYGVTRINPAAGERWFCSENDARAAGWWRALR